MFTNNNMDQSGWRISMVRHTYIAYGFWISLQSPTQPRSQTLPLKFTITDFAPCSILLTSQWSHPNSSHCRRTLSYLLSSDSWGTRGSVCAWQPLRSDKKTINTMNTCEETPLQWCSIRNIRGPLGLPGSLVLHPYQLHPAHKYKQQLSIFYVMCVCIMWGRG